MSSPTIKGLTTIVWGTNPGPNSPAGAIVETLRLTPKNGSPIEIEDNNGFAAAAVMLDDGFDAALTCLYDANKAWPGASNNVTLQVPQWSSYNGTNFAGGNMGGNVTNWASYNCFVGAAPEVDLSRKREATIAYKIVYRPGIAVS